MKDHNTEKHQFAVYVEHLSDQRAQAYQNLVLAGSDFVHRIESVLRFTEGDELIVFDQRMHAVTTITKIIKKKSIQLQLGQIVVNQEFKPMITVLLPLLKREALETAIYALTEVGVNHVQLIITQKSQQRWSAKEQERAQRISIAAAEQSKNFAFAQVHEPTEFARAIAHYQNQKDTVVLLDVNGKPFFSFVAQHAASTDAQEKHFVILAGPEGGLNQQELELCYKFHQVRLTPTILRASQAATISAAMVRAAL